MIAICPKCGNHQWDKEVEGNRISCPKCNHKWSFTKLPLFILTGCSGVGKTTTAQELQKITTDFVVLDADMFYNIMAHETDEDYYAQVEQIGSLSKNIMQCQKPVVWAMAGNIDKLPKTYHSRFFSDIYVLALICSEQELRKRMTEGRKITDEGWIQSSVDYNHYFQTHDRIGEMKFETYDMEEKAPAEAAEAVLNWMKGKAYEEYTHLSEM